MANYVTLLLISLFATLVKFKALIVASSPLHVLTHHRSGLASYPFLLCPRRSVDMLPNRDPRASSLF